MVIKNSTSTSRSSKPSSVSTSCGDIVSCAITAMIDQPCFTTAAGYGVDDDDDEIETKKNAGQHLATRPADVAFQDVYEIIQRLRSGSYGTVYTCKYRKGGPGPTVATAGGGGNQQQQQDQEKDSQQQEEKKGGGGGGGIDNSIAANTTTASGGEVEATTTTYAVKIIDRKKLKDKVKKEKQNNANLNSNNNNKTNPRRQQQQPGGGNTAIGDAGIFREVSIMKELSNVSSCTTIIQLIDFFIEQDTLYMVLVYAAGGDVFDRLSKRTHYTEHDARNLAKILLQTIASLHNVKPYPIVHRDLKPENLLLRYPNDDSSILLADFGFARHVNIPTNMCHTRCGTPSYVAPEVLLGIPYGTSVDLWSIGCLLYMLLGGYPPFMGNNHRDLFRKIRCADFLFHDAYFKNVSIPAKQLISSLLTVNATKRWTANMSLEQSIWLTSNNNEQLLRSTDLTQIVIPGLRKFKARQKWKSTAAAIGFAATAKFWNPDNVTFAQQIDTWDKQQQQTQVDQGCSGVNDTTTNTAGAAANSANTNGTSTTTTTTTATATARNDTAAATNTTTTTTTTTTTAPTSMNGNGNTTSLMSRLPCRIQFHDVYELRTKLRTGSSATVYECYYKPTKEIYAVKVINRIGLQPKDDEAVLNEVALMQSLTGSKYVVQLMDFYEENDAFYLVMEYLHGGDVFDRIVEMSHYTEHDARELATKLLKAVANIHSAGIAHRDIKPQNILLRNNNDNVTIKIADFGFARRIHTPESLTSRVGTPTYVAPEILKNIPHDERVDIWSVGIVIFVLLVGYPPFLEDDQNVLFSKIRTGDWYYHEDDWKHISIDAQELIRGLLVVDPKERWSIQDALRCKWIHSSSDHISMRQLSLINLTDSVRALKHKKNTLRALARAYMFEDSNSPCNNNNNNTDTQNNKTQPIEVATQAQDIATDC